MSHTRQTTILATTSLCFAYRDTQPIISDLTLSIHPSTLTALTGPSGSGKSTLLYLLGLMLRPTNGDVLLSGTPAGRLRDPERSALRAAEIGFVFQDAVLDPARSILENVIEGGLYAGLRRSEAKKRAVALLEDFGIAERKSHLPGEISGGQAQRVALCRALVKSPPIILADEPTGNLDEDSSKLVVSALRSEAARGRTVVVATHDPLVVDRCDEVVSLL